MCIYICIERTERKNLKAYEWYLGVGCAFKVGYGGRGAFGWEVKSPVFGDTVSYSGLLRCVARSGFTRGIPHYTQTSHSLRALFHEENRLRPLTPGGSHVSSTP